MKKKISILIIGVTMLFLVGGCSQQGAVRAFGGDMTIELEPNTKLELITWKDDDSLWYLTRPMTDNDIAETHTYQQSSAFGVFEGTITIVETKE